VALRYLAIHRAYSPKKSQFYTVLAAGLCGFLGTKRSRTLSPSVAPGTNRPGKMAALFKVSRATFTRCNNLLTNHGRLGARTASGSDNARVARITFPIRIPWDRLAGSLHYLRPATHSSSIVVSSPAILWIPRRRAKSVPGRGPTPVQHNEPKAQHRKDQRVARFGYASSDVDIGDCKIWRRRAGQCDGVKIAV
jgi:hypothetical protein